MRIKYTIINVILLLTLSFTFQNCKIYESQSVSVQEAVNSGKRVKIYTPEMDDYVFNQLELEGEQVIGVAKRKSKTAKDLLSSEELKESNDKLVRIPISDDKIGEVHEQNRTASRTLNIALIITGALTAAYFMFFAVN